MNVKIIIGAVCLISSIAFADQAAKEELIGLLEQQNTLQANFEQRTYQLEDASSDISHGNFTISKPMKFVWKVTSPFEQQVISDGETIWVYDPDLEQATYQSVDTTTSQSPAMILARPRQTLEGNFRVLSAGDDKLMSYRVLPEIEDSLFAEMSLIFIDNEIAELRFLDSLDQETVIVLEDVIINEPVNDDVFSFSPPEGTDLFEQM